MSTQAQAQFQSGTISPGTFDPVNLTETTGSAPVSPIEITPATTDLSATQAAPVSDIAELSSPAPSIETPLVASPVLPEERPTLPSATEPTPDIPEIAITPTPLITPEFQVEPSPFEAIIPETAIGRTAAIATTTAATTAVSAPGALSTFFGGIFGWIKGFFKTILAFFTTQAADPNSRKWLIWGLIVLGVILMLNWLSCTICSWTGGCKKEGFGSGFQTVIHPYKDPRKCVNKFDKKKDCTVPIGSGRLPWKVEMMGIRGDEGRRENFVPFNSEVVGKHQISLVRMDQMSLNGAFQALVNEDKGKLNINRSAQFRNQPQSREQGKQFVDHVLGRLNRKTDRRFHILDIQSIGKASTLDIASREVIERWTAELFVQEKDHRKVHAQAYNIRMVFYVKGNDVEIDALHFITDYFYKRPLIDGDNKYARHFRIKNPFHLQQPFLTSEDKVLPHDGKIDEVLAHHHKDLRTPQYRCFDGNASAPTTGGRGIGSKKANCDLSVGYWDKPVERDSECPFFRANKNYSNRLGGVDPNGNQCEMPMGTKIIGYRYVSNDPANKPLCYNCRGSGGMLADPGGIGPCCTEQLDKSKYPNLVSPDFAYPGDNLERYQHRRELAERGLNWRAHPTNIRDITNPNQRQPVFNSLIGPGPGKI